MPLAPNGRISLNDLKNEFGDPDGDGQFKFSEYYRGDSSSKPVKNISLNQNVPTAGEIRASNFFSTAGIFLPGITESGSGWPGILGVTNTWDTSQSANNSNSFPQASAYMRLTHEPASSRVAILVHHGNSTSGGTNVTNYLNYVGLEAATWEVKYTASSQTVIGDDDYLAWGPNPTFNGLASGTLYNLSSSRLFGWMSQATNSTQNARTSAYNVVFYLQATLGGNVYSTSYTHGDIHLAASKSPYRVIEEAIER